MFYEFKYKLSDELQNIFEEHMSECHPSAKLEFDKKEGDNRFCKIFTHNEADIFAAGLAIGLLHGKRAIEQQDTSNDLILQKEKELILLEKMQLIAESDTLYNLEDVNDELYVAMSNFAKRYNIEYNTEIHRRVFDQLSA